MRGKILLMVIVCAALFLSGCAMLNALKKPDISMNGGDTTVVVAPTPAPAPAQNPAQTNKTNVTTNATGQQPAGRNNSTENGTGAAVNSTMTINATANETAGQMNSSDNGTVASGEGNASWSGVTGAPMRPRQLEMDFYDVGFGDATLVMTNNLTLLIDTGTNDSASALVGKLRDAGVDRLDAVVITDWSADKTGGLTSLMDRFVIGEIWAPEQIPELHIYDGLADKLAADEIPLKTLDASDRLNYSDLTLDILNPPVNPYSSLHDINSMVIMFHYGKFCAFLPSDIQDEQGTMILGSVGDATCDVYKLPYHGEGRPTPSLLQERLNPSAVVISVGPNTEGLPSPTTLERLKLANISTWRTDVNGDIQVIADLNETYSIGPRAGANQTGAG